MGINNNKIDGMKNKKIYICANRAMRPVLCTIGKWSYLAGGMAITIKGKQASCQEAPILVVAPHSTFLDSCIVYATRMSSVIVRRESMGNYVGSMYQNTKQIVVAVNKIKTSSFARLSRSLRIIFRAGSRCICIT
ncbi:lysophospholipid acyltransferase LPCAT4-like [Arctopsyche grandis]|uniref:lysophospholipid acyltransferase LPCAT4-like n=1 Tax=Arctopsyche grandis TaxID=121162 RepID=UPI00406DA3AC